MADLSTKDAEDLLSHVSHEEEQTLIHKKRLPTKVLYHMLINNNY